MAFNYAGARATAAGLIANFGQSATLHKVTAGGTEFSPTLTEADFTITVVDLDQKIRDASGTLIGQSMRTLYIDATGAVPEKGDAVTVGGLRHEIAEVRTLNPGGTTVLYEADLAA